DSTPRSKYPKGTAGYKKTLIKYGASIGANATIVCGHTIGKWALIGSGAVVTRNVQDYALMLGVPAKQVGWVCECGERLLDEMQCKNCGRRYRQTEAGLEEVI
ncbi:MAG: N-acetyltransferase, partial [Hungatella sp.]